MKFDPPFTLSKIWAMPKIPERWLTPSPK